MIRTLKLVVVLTLAALMIGAYAASLARQAASAMFASLPTASMTGKPSASTFRPPELLEARMHYCDGTRTYALLSIPQGASFSMSVAVAIPSIPAGSAHETPIPVTGGRKTSSRSDALTRTAGHLLSENSCAEVGMVSGRTLVLCRGQARSRFTVTVRDAGVSQAFVFALPACAAHRTVASPASHQPEPSALTPSIVPVP